VLVAKKKGIVTALSFAVVFVALIGISVWSVYFSGPAIYHFPEKINITSSDWMTLIPSQADSVVMINVTKVVESGLPLSNTFTTFFFIQETRQTFSISNVTLLVTYYLPSSSPLQNETEIFLIKPSNDAYMNLQAALSNNSDIPRIQYLGFTLYSLHVSSAKFEKQASAILFMYKKFIIYTVSSPSPLGAAEQAVGIYYSQQNSLFTQNGVVKSVYAVVKNSTNYLSLNLENYPSTISGTVGGAKAVEKVGNQYVGVYAFQFPSEDAARQHYSQVTFVYKGGLSYYLLDNFVVANIPYSPSQVPAELQGF